MAQRTDVTVIVPVYDKNRFLPALLDSLVAQDTDGITFDAVCVDDGSTDGSGETLDRYAAAHDWLRVVHQPNSGWAGQPRNRGMDESDSRYVFFADADDYLGPQALRRLVQRADALGSDILMGKWVYEEDPERPDRLFGKEMPDVPVPLRFKTLRVNKLFRRDFLVEHDLRFVEHPAPLEDGMLMARAYLLAERVSNAVDHTYYYIVSGAETSISARRRDPWAQRRSVGTILQTVRELCPDKRTADEVCLDIYRRKGIRYVDQRLADFPPAFAREHVLAAADLADACLPEKLERRLSLRARLRSRLVRLRDVDASRALARAERSGPPPVRVDGERLVLDTGAGRATVDVTDDVPVQVEDVQAQPTARGAVLSAALRTPGARLTPPHAVRLLAMAPGGRVERLGAAALEPGGRPDVLSLRAELGRAAVQRVSALPRPVTLAVELRGAPGAPALASAAEEPVELAGLHREHRVARQAERRAAVRRRARHASRGLVGLVAAGVPRLARAVRSGSRPHGG